jgi:hypothetical protein
MANFKTILGHLLKKVIMDDELNVSAKLGAGRSSKISPKMKLKLRRKEMEIQRKLKQAASVKTSWPTNYHPTGKITTELGGKFESNRRKF